MKTYSSTNWALWAFAALVVLFAAALALGVFSSPVRADDGVGFLDIRSFELSPNPAYVGEIVTGTILLVPQPNMSYETTTLRVINISSQIVFSTTLEAGTISHTITFLYTPTTAEDISFTAGTNRISDQAGSSVIRWLHTHIRPQVVGSGITIPHPGERTNLVINFIGEPIIPMSITISIPSGEGWNYYEETRSFTGQSVERYQFIAPFKAGWQMIIVRFIEQDGHIFDEHIIYFEVYPFQYHLHLPLIH